MPDVKYISVQILGKKYPANEKCDITSKCKTLGTTADGNEGMEYYAWCLPTSALSLVGMIFVLSSLIVLKELGETW